MDAKKYPRGLSRRSQRLLDDFEHNVSDHREWNNEYNLKRARAALVAYILKLEEIEAGVKMHGARVGRR